MIEARILMNESVSFNRALRTVKRLELPHEFSRSAFQIYVDGITEAQLSELRDSLRACDVNHRIYIHQAATISTGWDAVETSCD